MVFQSTQTVPPENKALILYEGGRTKEDTVFWVGEYKYGHFLPVGCHRLSHPSHWFDMDIPLDGSEGLALAGDLPSDKTREEQEQEAAKRFDELRGKLNNDSITLL